jgi:hypothetical protein
MSEAAGEGRVVGRASLRAELLLEVGEECLAAETQYVPQYHLGLQLHVLNTGVPKARLGVAKCFCQVHPVRIHGWRIWGWTYSEPGAIPHFVQGG